MRTVGYTKSDTLYPFSFTVSRRINTGHVAIVMPGTDVLPATSDTPTPGQEAICISISISISSPSPSKVESACVTKWRAQYKNSQYRLTCQPSSELLPPATRACNLAFHAHLRAITTKYQHPAPGEEIVAPEQRRNFCKCVPGCWLYRRRVAQSLGFRGGRPEALLLSRKRVWQKRQLPRLQPSAKICQDNLISGRGLTTMIHITMSFSAVQY